MQTDSTENATTSETPEAAEAGSGNPSIQFRNPKKSKPTQILPSDRVTAEKQLEILRGFVAAAEATEGGAVTNDQAGEVVKMAGATVVVTNPFFTESGLIIRTDSGKFSVGQAAKEYQAAYQWEDPKAGRKLVAAFADRWFSRVLVPRLKMRPLPRSEAVGVLAEACKASPEYRPRLEMIIDFLNAAGIVSADASEVKLGDAEKGGDSRETGGGGGGSNGGGPPAPPPAEIKNEIPPDAPFVYLDPQRKKKVILLTETSEVTRAEWKRLHSWFKLQFFGMEDGKSIDLEEDAK